MKGLGVDKLDDYMFWGRYDRNARSLRIPGRLGPYDDQISYRVTYNARKSEVIVAESYHNITEKNIEQMLPHIQDLYPVFAYCNVVSSVGVLKQEGSEKDDVAYGNDVPCSRPEVPSQSPEHIGGQTNSDDKYNAFIAKGI